MGETILVTGGAGYIGSHACKALARAGYTPVTYDNLSGGYRWAVKWGPLEEGDILDRDRLRAAIDKHRPAAVMHFAGLISVGESVSRPGLYYRTNVMGSLCLLEAMCEAGIGRLVFSSTAAVYGMPRETPIPEGHPTEPINPYGTGKLMVERMLHDFSVAHGLRYAALRYFNAAGADPDGETGEAHDPETHLIPLVLAAAANNGTPVTIYGDDYDTPDGTCVRDYIHVTDLAAAHVMALETLDGAGDDIVCNLGTGTGYSVQELIETARRVTGRPVAANRGPRRAGDAPVLVASAQESKRRFGWQPKHSALENIVEDAWGWMNRHGGPHSKPS